MRLHGRPGLTVPTKEPLLRPKQFTVQVHGPLGPPFDPHIEAHSLLGPEYKLPFPRLLIMISFHVYVKR